jgi:hypothetical protein
MWGQRSESQDLRKQFYDFTCNCVWKTALVKHSVDSPCEGNTDFIFWWKDLTQFKLWMYPIPNLAKLPGPLQTGSSEPAANKLYFLIAA